jgi:hypothetical protein
MPFHPPNKTKLTPFTRVQVWPYLAEGDPLPSGPWYQVSVWGSRAWRSLNTVFSPLPPKIMIRDPAKIAECWYLGAGGVPEILFFWVKINYAPSVCIHIQYIGIVQIFITFLFSGIIVPLEINMWVKISYRFLKIGKSLKYFKLGKWLLRRPQWRLPRGWRNGRL